MLETGQTVGKYEIIRPLGAGGEGCVYLARDRTLSRLTAIKWIGEERSGTGEGREIIREAAFLRDLHHPMLPVVYDLLYEDGWYLVMEYIDGISLHNYINRQGGVGEEQGCIWAEALLTILKYLHSRKPPVIYRDLKPDNIIVCRDKNLRLVDLGAACLKNYGKSVDEQMALTQGYAAPEQQAAAGGCAYADERSDIYAFGRILYYMLTGADLSRPPYGDLPIGVYDPLLGEGVERVIRKCTREDPGERYQVVEEILRDLRKKDRYKRSCGRRNFVRHIEKRVWLTEKRTEGLL